MNKLSKNVLGMKFMRRTKEQVKKEQVEKTFREHFDSPVRVKVDSAEPRSSSSQPELTVIEIPSYNQVEGFIFGRQSFGGFNPTVESNLAKGVWKPYYLDEGVDEVKEEEEADSDADLPGEEDVDPELKQNYGSMVAMLGKKFLKKKKKGKGEEAKEPPTKRRKFMKPTDE